mgnify:CR=1 FL=1
MAEVNLNITELKGFVNHIIDNNRYLQQNGKGPVSVEVVGESGIGKTSTIVELAKDNNLNFVKLNLAQIEEIGDLVGFPVRQFQMYTEKQIPVKSSSDDLQMVTAAQRAGGASLANLNTTNTVTKKIGSWVDELAVQEYLKQGYKMTGKNRMSYCAPERNADKKDGYVSVWGCNHNIAKVADRCRNSIISIRGNQDGVSIDIKREAFRGIVCAFRRVK